MLRVVYKGWQWLDIANSNTATTLIKQSQIVCKTEHLICLLLKNEVGIQAIKGLKQEMNHDITAYVALLENPYCSIEQQTC